MSKYIFRQLYEAISSTYTYLLADPTTKEALIIDPVIETVERDAKLIQQLGLKLRYAVNTHVHADHVTGSGKLKTLFPECKSVLSKQSGAKADIYVQDGEFIKIGESGKTPVVIECRSTPGHTNGCMSFVWHDYGAVFTGDAVLIRGCGRTDFQQGSADQLYTSIKTKIFVLPDHYLVFPAHDYTGIHGILCSQEGYKLHRIIYLGQTCSSILEEKTHNPRLTKSREEFIDIMNNLKLSYPKQIDKALPANLICGLQGDI
ncbi:unnamed protein product [Rotaria sp. Silwood1]|nr:unnamed protein product [Rotaria sp. Silwood1]CAF4923282.1 unnamed protein product [Rotaria sp. Silwood1]CAF4988998.1 unnamed protein product [Rotaria sp. Silwood1]